MEELAWVVAALFIGLIWLFPLGSLMVLTVFGVFLFFVAIPVVVVMKAIWHWMGEHQ